MGDDRYHYDAKGNLTGYSSDTRRIDGCAVLGFIVLLLMIIGGVLSDWVGEETSKDGAQAQSEKISSQSVPDNADIDSDEHIEESESNNGPIEDNMDSKSEASTSAPRPSATAIDLAMRQAFETGSPVRWEDGGEKGYAVPSEPQADSGCRAVYYSLDSREGWQSPTKTICP